MGKQTDQQTKVLSLHMFDERHIWARFCEGEKAAFRELYDHFYTRMFVWGCKWLKGEEAFVRDTLHDFFIYLWERRARLSQPAHLSAYLLTSFKRRLTDGWEKEIQASGLDNLADQSESDLTEAETFSAQFALVQAALANLSPAQREVIEMRYLSGMSPEQIAAHKNTSLRTVYNLMHRGITQLRRQVGSQHLFFL
ncbi:RNA polymerase sigma factor [Chitinophaga rhizosphaerae]|uniref:RNA polymerase sigma factor n=1 Tax=Chitinophaga rhizosphaerae TaxID=1864947 RepID=UPI000F7FDBA3|nr:sigma-70 family RNA polymerase sigma factor [Chitinophaga rhizosphaerae]